MCCCCTKPHADLNFPFRAFRSQHLVERLVAVAVERHASLERLWHLKRVDPVAHHLVGSEAHELAVGVYEAQAVAVGKRLYGCHVKRVAPDLLYASNILAHSLRRVGRRDVWLARVEKIGCVSAVERFCEVRHKRVVTGANRGTSVFVGVLCYNLVKRLAVSCHHVLDISNVLQSALNLKRTDARLSHVLKVLYLAHVLQREQMSVVLYFVSLAVDEAIFHSAQLRTLAPVSATLKTMLRGVAQSGEADTQRAVHKSL